MKPLTPLQSLLIKHEGIRHSAYQDSLGYWTIGVGTLIDARMGGKLHDDEIEYIFNNRIRIHTRECEDSIVCFKNLDTVRRAALINLCFNMGIDKLLKFKNTLAAICDGRWDEAEAGLRNSKWATQVQKERVEDICHMIKTGEYR